ncbi:MAG: hypothetical protein H6719_04410 [Sandaracinaceae bacterium]|nr:hypothetical protein [Sandaracinaceae bacterium]
MSDALEALLVVVDGRATLAAPRPGLWRDGPPEGALVRAGTSLGALEVLGRQLPLVAPRGAFGVVTELPDGRHFARRPVDFGARLMVLDPEGIAGAATLEAGAADADASGPVFRTPLGGRFYARPSPDDPVFVKPGDTLKGGETVALIEVMKTFNRVRYDGEPATVVRVVPADGVDLVAGDVLLALE